MCSIIWVLYDVVIQTQRLRLIDVYACVFCRNPLEKNH